MNCPRRQEFAAFLHQEVIHPQYWVKWLIRRSGEPSIVQDLLARGQHAVMHEYTANIRPHLRSV